MSSRRPVPRVLIAFGVILVGTAGILWYVRMRPEPAAAARMDPAVTVATALAALERSENHRLSERQLAQILPLLRVLRDLDPSEVEPGRALARAILDVLSSEQRAEIQRFRDEARSRREAGGTPPRAQRLGAAGPQAGGAAPPGAVRVRGAARQRLLGRLIERLETRQ